MTIHVNSQAKSWTYTYATDISLAQRFHQRLPGYEVTPLVQLPSLARDLRVKAVFVKNESSRMNLPAFKILGASWGVLRAIATRTNISLDCTLENLALAACDAGLSLFAATSGNHGRAIAYMARILGIPASIFLADHPDEEVVKHIMNEGAEVVVVAGDYDDAVVEAARRTKNTNGGLHVQDYAWDGYEEIASWVVEGYSTMMCEIEQQLGEQGLTATHLVTPIGAGTLGLAVVSHARSEGRHHTVIAVEPETSACLHHNLRQDKLETVPPKSPRSIMTGLVCGNVNPIAWPVLRQGVDVSLTITDRQCHVAIGWLCEHGVNAGPCGAGTLAGFHAVASTSAHRTATGLDENSIVVLLSTEGQRYYRVPEAEQGQEEDGLLWTTTKV